MTTPGVVSRARNPLMSELSWVIRLSRLVCEETRVPTTWLLLARAIWSSRSLRWVTIGSSWDW
jgi:hypothetical protein